jgi:hypothetical protein
MSVDALEFLVRYGCVVLLAVVLGEQLGLPLVGASTSGRTSISPAMGCGSPPGVDRAILAVL